MINTPNNKLIAEGTISTPINVFVNKTVVLSVKTDKWQVRENNNHFLAERASVLFFIRELDTGLETLDPLLLFKLLLLPLVITAVDVVFLVFVAADGGNDAACDGSPSCNSLVGTHSNEEDADTLFLLITE